jgi:anthranilate synthase/indole-3-glycerol phosphate synthase/phosphoribosylanthranilate isomerase
METTTRLMQIVFKDTIVCALSGIASPSDVVPYQKQGVGAVLIGEALMRAKDTAKFIAELLGGDEKSIKAKPQRKLLVKICGTRSAEAASAAIQAGADLVGIILVKGRKRCVTTETALQISEVVHGMQKTSGAITDTSIEASGKASSFFAHTAAHHIQHPKRALLVGVFQDQPLDDVLAQQKLLNLDIVQLHGSEPLEWASLIPVPVIRSFKPGHHGLASRGFHSMPLLDSGSGSGKQLDIASVKDLLKGDEGLRVLLAGGLDPDNVAQAVEAVGENKYQLAGVDVSSGVEVDGEQNLDKIRAFVSAAKAVEL